MRLGNIIYPVLMILFAEFELVAGELSESVGAIKSTAGSNALSFVWKCVLAICCVLIAVFVTMKKKIKGNDTKIDPSSIKETPTTPIQKIGQAISSLAKRRVTYETPNRSELPEMGDLFRSEIDDMQTPNAKSIGSVTPSRRKYVRDLLFRWVKDSAKKGAAPSRPNPTVMTNPAFGKVPKASKLVSKGPSSPSRSTTSSVGSPERQGKGGSPVRSPNIESFSMFDAYESTSGTDVNEDRDSIVLPSILLPVVSDSSSSSDAAETTQKAVRSIDLKSEASKLEIVRAERAALPALVVHDVNPAFGLPTPKVLAAQQAAENDKVSSDSAAASEKVFESANPLAKVGGSKLAAKAARPTLPVAATPLLNSDGTVAEIVHDDLWATLPTDSTASDCLNPAFGDKRRLSPRPVVIAPVALSSEISNDKLTSSSGADPDSLQSRRGLSASLPSSGDEFSFDMRSAATPKGIPSVVSDVSVDDQTSSGSFKRSTTSRVEKHTDFQDVEEFNASSRSTAMVGGGGRGSAMMSGRGSAALGGRGLKRCSSTSGPNIAPSSISGSDEVTPEIPLIDSTVMFSKMNDLHQSMRQRASEQPSIVDKSLTIDTDDEIVSSATPSLLSTRRSSVLSHLQTQQQAALATAAASLSSSGSESLETLGEEVSSPSKATIDANNGGTTFNRTNEHFSMLRKASQQDVIPEVVVGSTDITSLYTTKMDIGEALLGTGLGCVVTSKISSNNSKGTSDSSASVEEEAVNDETIEEGGAVCEGSASESSEDGPNAAILHARTDQQFGSMRRVAAHLAAAKVPSESSAVDQIGFESTAKVDSAAAALKTNKFTRTNSHFNEMKRKSAISIPASSSPEKPSLLSANESSPIGQQSDSATDSSQAFGFSFVNYMLGRKNDK